MREILPALFFCIAAYLTGSIPFGLLYGKIFKGIDIRNFGSGNIGATNVRRVIGFKAFVVVLILDGLKGFIPVLLSWQLVNGNAGAGGVDTAHGAVYYLNGIIPVAVGLCCIAGHVKSIFIKFTGGKAVATSIGVLLAIVPLPALSGVAVWMATVLITRYVSLGSILAILAINIFSWFLPENVLMLYVKTHDNVNLIYVKIMLAMLFLLVIATHIANIKRLIQGREYKFGEKVDVK